MALEKHPNIVRCFYVDILDNRPFMVLEWIAGEEGKGADLRGWLRHGPLDLKTALEITLDVVRGLLHAQAKQPGLVHRDLKPENILVAQGGLAKITDFGLAQIVEQAGLEVEAEVDGRQNMIHKGGIAGTPAYMAPEQWRGETLDERTDIYAVGCILYELLTARLLIQDLVTPSPQMQGASNAIRTDHGNVPTPALPAIQPMRVNELVTRCLAKKPANRPPSLRWLLAQLEAIYQQQFDRSPPSRPDPTKFTVADYNNRGNTYDHLQQYERALADYRHAIDLDPNLAQVYSNRGLTYAALQQTEAALADFERAIALDPTYTKSYYNRGTTYQKLQRYEMALADFERAIALDPNLAQTYSNQGLIYHKLQKYEAALADFEQAIALDPNLAQAYSNRGLIYHELQKYEAALADFEQAIALDPNLAQAYYNRGLTYAALQQTEAALADFERAITLDPNFAQAYFNLAVALAHTGHLRKSLPFFEQAALLGEQSAVRAISYVRQILGESSSMPGVDLAQQVFDAFQQASSPWDMRQVVAQFPYMAQVDFTAAIEQFITQQVSPEHRPHFKQRLDWLRQIAKEQNQ